jgi:hypothetical protein
MAVDRFLGGPCHGESRPSDGKREEVIRVRCEARDPRTKLALYVRDGRTDVYVFRGYVLERTEASRL